MKLKYVILREVFLSELQIGHNQVIMQLTAQVPLFNHTCCYLALVLASTELSAVFFVIYGHFRPTALCLAVVTMNINVTQIDLGKCGAAKT